MDILLSTLNAKFIHPSLGLRCLRANLGELRERSSIVEFTFDQDPCLIAEEILSHQPRIIGFGVYIWNLIETEHLVSILKDLAPDLHIVLGGPELSHQGGTESICRLADTTLGGEADLVFAQVCRQLLSGESVEPFIACDPPDLESLELPYGEYTPADLTHRLTYVEASRGCPFRCEFCLSSMDKAVREFPHDAFLQSLERLLDQGCRTFKFVDRTFNLKATKAVAIMDFFLDRWCDELFLHFEMVPDRLPEEIRERLPRFPKGGLQFEIGIQSFTPHVGEKISRRMNLQKTTENFHYLKSSTQVHTHADLIIGLPGENLQEIGSSFDQLWKLGPDEIQIGILKRLKGTPIARHDQEHRMVYSRRPPYEILSNDRLDFTTLQELKRFARHFEIFANSGRFPRSLQLLAELESSGSFQSLFAFSKWLWRSIQQVHAIRLSRQVELLLEWAKLHGVHETMADAVCLDFLDGKANPEKGRKGLPHHLHQRMDRLQRTAS